MASQSQRSAAMATPTRKERRFLPRPEGRGLRATDAMNEPVEGRPALFVDLDNTVRETLSGRAHPIWPEDQTLRPGALDRLEEYRARGYAIVGVTNQGGVAFGTLSEQD